MRVGVLAVQGDYAAHLRMLERLSVDTVAVTHPKQLSGLRGLILPGGESPTQLKFLQEEGLFDAILDFAKAGRGLFGTCAGAILLASQVTHPQQPSLGLVDVTIERNAYGRQLASHIGQGQGFDQNNLRMVFIRAPKITHVDDSVTVLAIYQGEPVAVRQNRCLLTTFHPELTEDICVHETFLKSLLP